MICPNCLSNNSNSSRVCKKCGCPLDDIKPEQEYSQYKPKQNNATNETNENLRYTVKEVVAQDISYEDFDDTPSVAMEVRSTRQSQTNSRSRAPMSGKSGVYSSEKIKTHKAKRTITMVVTIILWLAVLGGLVFGVYYGGKAILEALNYVPPITTPAPDKTPDTPDIAIMTDDNNTQYINCKFYGENGDSVYIEQLNQRFNIENGSAQINIYLSDLLSSSSSITTETIPVTLKAKYRFANSQETSLTLPTVEFNIPKTEIIVLSADSTSIEVFQDTYKIVFAVPKGSNLYINDAISNDKIDSSGRVEYSVDVFPGQSIPVRFKVQAPYHTVTEKTFTIYRKTPSTTLVLSGTNPKVTNTDSIKLVGQIEQGTTITCDPKYTISNFIYNDNGTFSLDIKLPDYGKHDILLTATDKTESKTAKLIHTVNYLPDETTYTTSAWKYESNISKNYKQYMNKQHYLFKAKITGFVLAENKTFAINMGTEEDPEIIYVEYTGPLSLNTTTTYRIFGNVIGQKDGKTLVAARYIYNW